MSPLASFAVPQNHDVSQVAFDLSALPKLPKDKRRVLEQGLLPNGENYSIQILKPEDAPSVHALCDAEYARAETLGKCALLRRTPREIQKMMDFDFAARKGGVVLGAVLGRDRLGMVGGIGLIDEEAEGGRGNPYIGTDHDSCTIQQQIYFKMAAAHPTLQNSGLNLAKILYPHRLAVGLLFDERKCFLTKISGASVKRAYEKNGWTRVDEFRLPEADDPAFDLTDEEKILATYRLSRNEALSNLAKNHQDVHRLYLEQKEIFDVFATRRKSAGLDL